MSVLSAIYPISDCDVLTYPSSTQFPCPLIYTCSAAGIVKGISRIFDETVPQCLDLKISLES